MSGNEKIQAILQYLKNAIRYDGTFIPRPFFVEITGPPSSGKTTIIKELDKFFRRQGLRVICPQEGAEIVRHIERTTPLYNIRTGLYALQLLIDWSHGHLYDIVIFDRCIFDAYCWMMYWQEKTKLSPEEVALLQQFFLFRLWADKIDVAYFAICDPDVAMKRELRIALSEDLGETTNPKTIAILRERYLRAYQALSAQNPQLNLIDTTNMGEHEMVKLVMEKTLRIFEEKALVNC